MLCNDSFKKSFYKNSSSLKVLPYTPEARRLAPAGSRSLANLWDWACVVYVQGAGIWVVYIQGARIFVYIITYVDEIDNVYLCR